MSRGAGFLEIGNNDADCCKVNKITCRERGTERRTMQ